MIFGLFLVSLLVKVFFKTKEEFMKAKDVRINRLKNAIENIRFIKVRSLENFYAAKIYEKRAVEIRIGIKIAYLVGFWVTLNWFMPSLVYVCSILWVLL